MCGLVGTAGNLDYSDEGVFKRLLVLDVFRGFDSTGAVFVGNKGEAEIVKMATNPINLFQHNRFAKLLNGYRSRAFIGHNRAATLGKVNDLNAHPFNYGSIYGAHNGTLDQASWSRLEQAAGVKTSVDSAAIFACIDKIGLEETISLMEKGRTSSTGAWALTWYDEKDDTINFIRNEHRPLWFGFNKNKDKILWSSEWPMMDAAVELTKSSDPFYEDPEGFSFWPFEEDIHYCIPISQLIGGMTIHTFLNECKGSKKIEGREPAPFVQEKYEPKKKNGGKAPFVTKTSTSQSSPHTSKTSDTSSDKEFKDDEIPTFGYPAATDTSDVIHANFDKERPFGGYISEREFEDIAKYGCSFCQTEVNIDDPNITVYKQDKVVLCSDCSRSNDGNQKIYM